MNKYVPRKEDNDTYPVPVVEQTQWNYKYNGWPGNLTCDHENAQNSDEHGNGETHEKR